MTATFETPAAADTVFEAIQVEAGEIADDRTRASVSRAGRAVVVTIQAGDLTALRAGTRTWTGLLDVASTIATGDGAE